jgi:ABC-type transport system involved in cytochrome c biogenesis permease subunit
MHETSVFWLRVAVALYSVGLWHALFSVLRKPQALFRPALAAFSIAVVLHLVSIIDLTRLEGHLPVGNFYQSMSVCAFFIALVFLFVYWRYQFASLSVFLFPLVFVMSLVGSTELPVSTWADPGLRDAWLLVHVVLVLSGYSALLLTAVASLFYLVQERQLKSKRPGRFFERLPPLGTLDQIITKSLGFGFVFITLALIAGSTWAFIESGTRWVGEAKITIALVTWVLYLVAIFVRATAGWRGRKAAIMAIVLVCCSALTWAAHIGLRRLLLKQ